MCLHWLKRIGLWVPKFNLALSIICIHSQTVFCFSCCFPKNVTRWSPSEKANCFLRGEENKYLGGFNYSRKMLSEIPLKKKKKVPTASILKQPNKIHQRSCEKTTKSSHSQFFPFSYHHICQISDVCQPFMQEKGGGKMHIWEWNAPLDSNNSGGSVSLLRSAPFLMFFFSSPSLPASQRVSTAESAPARMKMSPRGLCHTWILYSSRRGEAGSSSPPRGRRPYPASAEGKVPCKGSKLFYACRPKPVEHNNAIAFLTPPGPTFRENGRIFRTFWWMICTRHDPRWNCLLCFVWGGGELI